MTDLIPTRVHNLIIVDESGSMECIRKQAFTGMNETLQTVRMMQKKYPHQLQYVTLITFDSDHTKLHFDNTLADNFLYLCNGFQKKAQKTPANEIEKAIKIKEAYYADKQSQNR